MMTDARKGQIALLLLKHRLRKEGVRLVPDFKRSLASDAKELGIPVQEALEFYEGIIRENVDEIFASAKK